MAVNRRQKENDTFSDIANILPIEENAKELDKASILRIAIHYLRLRDIITDCEPDSEFDCDSDDDLLKSALPNFSKDVLQALDGFLLLVSREGRVLFASESISHYLGLRQVDVIGIDLQDIIHPQDFMDVAAIFQSQGNNIGPEMLAMGSNHLRRNFVVRMRCAFTPSVRSVTRCSNFKPIYCSAFLKFSDKKIKEGEFLGMVTLCKVASTVKMKELCVGAYFKTKHSLDLSYTAIDTRIRWILGFDPAKMVGLKAYDYFHPEDLLATSSCHTNLLTQGHSHSPCYRFMTQGGDWVWVRSKSCVTYDPVTHLPNGLSIYTWIVRYDEEDERMKMIVDGKDAGNVGVKDVSQASADIKALCNTSTNKTMSLQHELSHSPQSAKSVSRNSSKDDLSPPESVRSLATSHCSPVHSLSSMVSPEMSNAPPPNVNPFQSFTGSSCNGGSPTSSLTSISSPQSVYHSPPLPPSVVGDPFVGMTTSVGFTNTSGTTTTHNQYNTTSAVQHLNTSPPFTSSCPNVNMYNFTSTPSPDNTTGLTLTSPDSYSSSSHEVFGDVSQYSSPQHYSVDHSPYSSCSNYSNPSLYSGDQAHGFVSSPPQPGNSISVEATLYGLPSNYGGHPHQLKSQQQQHSFKQTGYTIKQEPFTGGYYDNHQYRHGNNSAVAVTAHVPTSAISQTKARYSSVAVAGKHHHYKKATTQEDAAILGISQWLQQGSTPVH